MEDGFSFLPTILTALFTALLAYYFTEKQRQHEIVKEQKYQYFFPFKYQAEELLARAIFMEERLAREQKKMKTHFSLSFEGKGLEWYFKDWEDVPNLISGGYFLTSTVYMHCLLYNKMYALQGKFPYIKVKIKNSLEKSNATNELFSRYLGKQVGGTQIHHENDPDNWNKMKGVIDFKNAVHAVRSSTIMALNEGILNALHYSLGDFVSDGDGGTINYEKFCLMLMDSAQRVKFSPLINFWNGMVDESGSVNSKRLNLLRSLIIALMLVQACDLK